MLEHNEGIACMRISSPTPRSIGFCAEWHKIAHVCEIPVIIEDTPCLERMLQLGTSAVRTVRVIQAPKLEIVGPLYMSKLHLGTTFFQVIAALISRTAIRVTTDILKFIL